MQELDFTDTLSEIDVKELSPVALAFVGDSVLDILVRTRLVGRSRQPVSILNKAASEIVSAKGQSSALLHLDQYLSNEEKEWVRRGRNAKKSSVSKSATLQQYRASTGLESMLGWLYLQGNTKRIEELFELMWQYHKQSGNHNFFDIFCLK